MFFFHERYLSILTECFVHEPVRSIDLEGGATDGVHQGSPAPLGTGGHLVTHVDVVRKHTLQKLLVGFGDDLGGTRGRE